MYYPSDIRHNAIIRGNYLRASVNVNNRCLNISRVKVVRSLIATSARCAVIFRLLYKLCRDNIDVTIIKAEGDTIPSRIVAHMAQYDLRVKESIPKNRLMTVARREIIAENSSMFAKPPV